MMTVGVLGHRGMLGHVVARYFREQGLKVVTLDQRFQSGDELEEFVEAVCREPVAWWVNCIGARPGQEVGVDWLELVNHQLPALCSSYLPKSCGFIHASSDGVFQSQSGACQWDRLPDAVDDYGRTKLLAERSLTRANDWIIRCSIVGPEQDTQRSLLGWLMHSTGEVAGFTNQKWNGVTTLQWAKHAFELIRADRPTLGRILQPACEPVVSKGELVEQLVAVWELPLQVRLESGPRATTRYLVGNRTPIDLREQLAEMREWY